MELFDEDDMSDFLDGADDDYEEDLSPWNYDDWLASGIETSADLNQFVDNEYVRLTSLAPPNSTLPLDVAEQLRTLPTDSSSSSTLVYTLIDLTENCISPALSQLVNQLSWILIFCCLFRLLCLSKLCSSRTLHYVQIGASIVILYNYFHFQSIYLLTYIFMGYLAFQVCLDKCRNYLTYIIVCFSLIYVLACEFILIEREQWHSIRGVQMCIMMKMISVAIDYPYFESVGATNTKDSVLSPTGVEFFSYILSIHNTIFGPWMNYRNYISRFHQNNHFRKIDFFELAKWTYYFLRLAVCLLVSTCLTDWFLRHMFSYDDLQDQQHNGWRIAYIQALSYRFSHYSVCFIGELCGQISGLEFNADEYRNYAQITRCAKERIDAQRKSDEQARAEMAMASSDAHAGKRKHRQRKTTNKSEEQDAVTSTNSEEHHDSSQIPSAMENGSSTMAESELALHDEPDPSYHRTLVNRFATKKPSSHNAVTSKRKPPARFTPPTSLSSSSTRSSPGSSTSSHSSAVVKPFHIELPHSLVDVVVNWNLPMHHWLKIYVYTPMKQRYGHLTSVLVTYLASALLHGFNFQLSVVLFSIGLFAYVEFGFRRKLAHILDACVGARTCPSRTSCDKHSHTYWHPMTLIVNLFLCLLSLWHLTYLGQLFDNSAQESIGYSWQHVLDKWARLNFASHLVVIGTYAVFRSL